MARRVFFSFHYQRDVWRVNQIRNIPNVVGTAAAGFQDAGLWEEAKRKGDAAIKKLIDDGLVGTSVTVVCIGYMTAQRKYVNYEIEKSLAVGNGIVAVRINHLIGHDGRQDPPGAVPQLIVQKGFAVNTYTDASELGRLVEQAARAAGR